MKQSKFTFSFTLLVLICETNRFAAVSFSPVCLSEHLYKAGAVGKLFPFLLLSTTAAYILLCTRDSKDLRCFWAWDFMVFYWTSRMEGGHNKKRRFLIWVTLFRQLKIWGHQARLGQLFGKKQYLYQQKGNEAEKESFPWDWIVMTSILGDRQSWNWDLHLLDYK